MHFMVYCPSTLDAFHGYCSTFDAFHSTLFSFNALHGILFSYTCILWYTVLLLMNFMAFVLLHLMHFMVHYSPSNAVYGLLSSF